MKPRITATEISKCLAESRINPAKDAVAKMMVDFDSNDYYISRAKELVFMTINQMEQRSEASKRYDHIAMHLHEERMFDMATRAITMLALFKIKGRKK